MGDVLYSDIPAVQNIVFPSMDKPIVEPTPQPKAKKLFLEDMFRSSLPDECFSDPVIRYLNLVDHCTEASNEHHLAVFLTVIGNYIGRSAWVTMGMPTYPNLFMTLIGPTGDRKTTSMRLGTGILERVQPTVPFIHNVGSAEGLIREWAQAELPNEQKSLPTDRIIDHPTELHRRCIVMEDEIAAFLIKANRENAGPITQKFIQAFDCHDPMKHSVSRMSVVANKAVVSFLSGSNAFWIQQNTTMEQIMGGFSNRFMFIDGKPKPAMPRPGRINEASAAREVFGYRSIIEERHCNPAEMPFSDEAGEHWDKFYHALDKSKCRNAGLAPLFIRLPDNAIKTSIIYAILDQSRVISLQHLKAGIGMCLYSGRCLEETLSPVTEGKRAKLDGSIKRFLKKKGAYSVESGASVREISQNIYGDWNCDDINRSLRSMAGQFVDSGEDPREGRGRKAILWFLLSE